jgi:hypothetical protein
MSPSDLIKFPLCRMTLGSVLTHGLGTLAGKALPSLVAPAADFGPMPTRSLGDRNRADLGAAEPAGQCDSDWEMAAVGVSELKLTLNSSNCGFGHEGGAGHAALARGFINGQQGSLIDADIGADDALGWQEVGDCQQIGTIAERLHDLGVTAQGFDRPSLWDVARVDVKAEGFGRLREQLFTLIRCRKAPRHIGKPDAISACGIFIDDGDVGLHGHVSFVSGPASQPAARAIWRAVPIGRSFFGCGTVTRAFPFTYWWCDPAVALSTHPSRLRRWMILRLSRSIMRMIIRSGAMAGKFGVTLGSPRNAIAFRCEGCGMGRLGALQP